MEIKIIDTANKEEEIRKLRQEGYYIRGVNSLPNGETKLYVFKTNKV